MGKKITYLFGAGASANALPVVRNLTDRFEIFCNHFLEYLKSKDSDDFTEVKNQQKEIITKIKKHYTIDTYARKLYLQNPRLHTNEEYNLLVNYLSAYFIYEQLSIDSSLACNKYLENLFGYTDIKTVHTENVKKILTNFDYRYDSFFASILKHNEENQLIIPNNINFISWNYDFQIEKAFMNFSGGNLDDAMLNLNVIGTPHITLEKPVTYSHLIKLNGTAGFVADNKFSTLFDFSEHELNNNSFKILKEILTSSTSKYQNGLRFSWEKSNLSTHLIEQAQFKIEESEIIVIIGYSFPYFNRETDRAVFKNALSHGDTKIYIQSAKEDIDSISNRFMGVLPSAKVIPFTELDQFLIPNELE